VTKTTRTLFFLFILSITLLPIFSISLPVPIHAQPPISQPSTISTVGFNKLKKISATNYVLYSDALAIHVVWDGTKRYDEILNHTVAEPWTVNPISYWCKWKVEWYKGTPPQTPWVSLTDSSVQFLNPIENSTGAYLTVNATMNDGSIFTVTYKLQGKLKWDLKFKASNAWTTQYRFTYEYFTVPCEKTTVETVKEVVFSYAPEFWIKFLYDDVDLVTYPKVETWDSANYKFYFSIDLGTFTAWQTKEIDPSTVGTSTTTNAVSNSYQRKSFFSLSAGRFGAFYGDGSNVGYKTSLDGSTWSNFVVFGAQPNGPAISVCFDGTYLHYARETYGTTEDLYYRRGILNSDGSFTWSAVEQLVIDATVDDRAEDPTVAVDSSGYVYIGYKWFDGTNRYPYITKNTNNDGTWSTASGYPLQLSTTAGGWGVSIIGLTSSRMYVIYAYGGARPRGKLYTGSWGTEETITALGNNIENGLFHSAVGINDDVHFVYLKATSYDICYLKRTYGTGWSSEVTVRSATTSTSSPALSINSNNDLYCFWVGSPTANHIYYKKNSGGTWDTNPTDWIDETTDGISSNRGLSCFYQRYGAYIGLLYMTKTASPYNVRFAYLNFNTAPTNNALSLDLTGASYKGTKTLLTAKQDYKFVYQCSDANGVTDITYAEIRLDYATKNVILRATRGSGDAWTFAEQSDPSNYVTLNTGTSSHSTSGNQKTFNFYVTINWNWDDATETLGVRAYVIDSASATDTDDYANVFGVENDLASASLTVSDYRVNPSQTGLTFSGYWYYEGTSIAPPDGNYAVVIKLAGVQKGSTDTTLVSGAFSINDVTAESTVASYSYTVEATYMASAGSFSAVIVDRMKVNSYTVSDSRANINDNVNIDATVVYEYDSTAVTTGTITINGFSATHQGSGVYRITRTSASVTAVTYNTVACSAESSYGITTVDQNSQSVTVIWDHLQVQSYTVSDSRANTNDNVNIDALIWFDYDNTPCTTATLTINGFSATHQGSGVYRITRTSASVTSVTYDTVACSAESTYGITTVDQNSQSATVIWDRYIVNYKAADDYRQNVNGSVELRFELRSEYDNMFLTLGSVSINGTSASYDAVNGWWKLTVTRTTVGSNTYVVSAINEATYGITALDSGVATNSTTVTWDGLKVSAYSIDMTNMKVYVRLLYAYDNSAVANGNVSLAGLYALTNSTGWATFDMITANDFSYSQVAYGVQDATYGITYKHTNHTLPIAKKNRLIQSDATISSLAWDGTKLSVTFSGASGSYTLKVSGARPTYILNVTYNLANNYTAYLSLNHDGSRKIVISYATWGDFYVRSLNHILQDIYWTDQKLTLVLNGTSDETGALTIYAGDRANPESTSGFTSASYNTNTKIFAGNYQFSSLLTLILDWTKAAGVGGGGPSIYFQLGHLNLDATVGTKTPFTLNIEFNVHRITITRIEWGNNPEWFKITDTLPTIFYGTGPTTYAKINGEITPTAGAGETLNIPITVYGQGPDGQQLQSGATLTLTITQPPPGADLTETLQRMLGDPLILILLITFAAWLGYYELREH